MVVSKIYDIESTVLYYNLSFRLVRYLISFMSFLCAYLLHCAFASHSALSCMTEEARYLG